MTDDLLTRAKALLDGITPGPWVTQGCSHGGAILLRGDKDADLRDRHSQGHLQIVPTGDAEFIAASPELVRALVAEVERLRKDNAELRTAFREVALSRAFQFAELERERAIRVKLVAKLAEWEGWRGFIEVHGCQAPAHLDGGVKQSLQQMGKLFSNGISKIDWIVPNEPGRSGRLKARFDGAVLARLEQAHAGKSRNEITMDGRLEMADFKIDDLKCIVHTPDGQRVVCTFTKDLEDDVYKALRGIARVTGLGTYVQPSNRLERIDLYSVKKLDPFLGEGESFFESLSLAELTKAQGVDPAFDLRTLPNTWPEDEDVEAFLEAIGER